MAGVFYHSVIHGLGFFIYAIISNKKVGHHARLKEKNIYLAIMDFSLREISFVVYVHTHLRALVT